MFERVETRAHQSMGRFIERRLESLQDGNRFGKFAAPL